MEHIIGIDVGSEVSSVVAMNKHGRVVLETRIATSERNLRELVKSIRGPRKIVFEECGQAAWLYSILEPLSAAIIVCDPKKNKDLSGNSKDDDRDAFNLTERCRLNALSPVWHGGKSLQALRDHLRDYQLLTSESTAMKNRIKAVFRNRGISIGNRAYDPAERKEAIKLLPIRVLRTRVIHLGEVLDTITEQRSDALQQLVKSAKKNKMFSPLCSMPRIGDIFASTIIGEVGTPERFRTRKQFWSYIGLAVTTFETGEYYTDERNAIRKKRKQARTRGLVRRYNRSLKYVFKHVGMDLAGNEWADEFKRLESSGVNKPNAWLTLSRKAAAVALHLMKTGEMYNEELVFARK